MKSSQTDGLGEVSKICLGLQDHPILRPVITFFGTKRKIEIDFLLKSKVHVTEPESMDELKQRITQCIHEIPADMISRVVQEYPSRLRQVIRNGSRHVEVEILDI